MSATATADPAKKPGPPEEQFWVRYSPHYEMPLSWVGSGTVHALALGVLLLTGLAISFLKDNNPLPIDSVRVGGGGGDTNGHGNKRGTGDGEAINAPKVPDERKFDKKVEADELPKGEDPVLALPELPDNATQIEKLREMARINAEEIKKSLRRPKGEGGPGAGGGDGRGDGPRKGNDNGPGDGDKQDKRVVRMHRWTMTIDIRTGADYAKQLRSLGVMIAVDLPDDPGAVCVYTPIKPNASGRVTKLKDIHRMPWFDRRPESVGLLCGYMGISPTPPRLIAYMTEEMEENLLRLELKAAGGVEENKIVETVFKIEPRGDHYEPIVASQRLK
jgi:hypothetical protein